MLVLCLGAEFNDRVNRVVVALHFARYGCLFARPCFLEKPVHTSLRVRSTVVLVPFILGASSILELPSFSGLSLSSPYLPVKLLKEFAQVAVPLVRLIPVECRPIRQKT